MLNRCCELIAFAALTLAPLSNIRCAPNQQTDVEIQGFNDALRLATSRINIDELLALWEEGGITLLPGIAPIAGKSAIARYLHEVTTQLGFAHMQQFDLNCFDIIVTGDLASEWCTEHQIVDLGKDKPPFEGLGKMLLVLHRGADGQWRLVREMWNQGSSKR